MPTTFYDVADKKKIVAFSRHKAQVVRSQPRIDMASDLERVQGPYQVLLQVAVLLGGVFMGVTWEKSVFLFVYHLILSALGTVAGIIIAARAANKYANTFNRLSIETELMSKELEALKKAMKDKEG